MGGGVARQRERRGEASNRNGQKNNEINEPLPNIKKKKQDPADPVRERGGEVSLNLDIEGSHSQVKTLATYSRTTHLTLIQ